MLHVLHGRSSYFMPFVAFYVLPVCIDTSLISLPLYLEAIFYGRCVLRDKNKNMLAQRVWLTQCWVHLLYMATAEFWADNHAPLW